MALAAPRIADCVADELGLAAASLASNLTASGNRLAWHDRRNIAGCIVLE